MAEIAYRRLGKAVDFELSVTNVDKPSLGAELIINRVQQLERLSNSVTPTIWITAAKTFAQKLSLFPSATFVVGADTIRRIADSRYYDHDESKMNDSIRRLGEGGCRFLVFGRVDGPEDNFKTLSNIPLPEELLSICDQVTEGEFREDIASRDLRNLRDK